MKLLTKIELLTKEEMKEWNLSDVVSVAINLGIYYHAGQEKGLDILTANKQILIEKILDIVDKDRKWKDLKKSG